MTHIVETADGFVGDALEGMVEIHADLVRRVDGGVARRAGNAGRVAVVTGGGSGHYPAFAGYVGSGLATAAVVGELFASPSTGQILRLCDEVDMDAGVVFVYGNYAGDVLNFTAAAKSLAAGDIRAECLAVTDDVASAPAAERERRRGVAGDIPVIKVLGAAADRGDDLPGVLALGRLANDRTRSFGVAFSGATMPGQRRPMFSLPAGTMGIGLGIHGEPGISEVPVASASDIARLLVQRVWQERPADADDRVAVVLNGLGSTKQEELFVLWRYVSVELRARGARVVEPLVGEYVTSLDMAGCSLTVLWLDDLLEPLWCAPAEAPALHRGSLGRVGPVDRTGVVRSRARVGVVTGYPADDHSRWLAGQLQAGFALVAETLVLAEAQLGRLDAQAGDGDHGQGMARGSAAALAACQDAVGTGAGGPVVMAAAARAWADRAGGTSGALWGTALEAAAGVLEAHAASGDGHDRATALAAACARAALGAIQQIGGAVVGDKTMVDALAPFVVALEAAAAQGRSLQKAWWSAAAEATHAAQATKDLLPRLGRARPLAERSLGHPDAGAISLALVITCVSDLFADGATMTNPERNGARS